MHPQPARLGFAVEPADNEPPEHMYAAAYPTAMILLAQEDSAGVGDAGAGRAGMRGRAVQQ